MGSLSEAKDLELCKKEMPQGMPSLLTPTGGEQQVELFTTRIGTKGFLYKGCKYYFQWENRNNLSWLCKKCRATIKTTKDYKLIKQPAILPHASRGQTHPPLPLPHPPQRREQKNPHPLLHPQEQQTRTHKRHASS